MFNVAGSGFTVITQLEDLRLDRDIASPTVQGTQVNKVVSLRAAIQE